MAALETRNSIMEATVAWKTEGVIMAAPMAQWREPWTPNRCDCNIKKCHRSESVACTKDSRIYGHGPINDSI